MTVVFSFRNPGGLFRGKTLRFLALPTPPPPPPWPPLTGSARGLLAPHPHPTLNAPPTRQKLREEAASRKGGGRGLLASRITHRRSAGRRRGPAPTGPSWRAADESLVPFEPRSHLRPTAPELRCSHLEPHDPPTTPQAGPAAFHPPLLAGGGRETRIHQSRRTTHTLHPIETRGGDRHAPIGAVQVRCSMPEAWLLPIGHP